MNINGNATVTLENVQIIDCRWYGVVCNDGSTLTVNGVESSGHGFGGINVDKGGKATIDDYTSGVGETAAVIYENTGNMGGSLTVNGGSFQNIVVQVGENESPAGTVSINGGTFTGTEQSGTNSGGIVYIANGSVVSNLDTAKAALEDVVTITDGTFPNGKDTLVEKLLSEGSSLDEESGKIVPTSGSVAAIGGVGYKTLSEALTAAENGTNKTVTLMADATLSSKIESGVTLVVPADKTLTVDKSNYTTLFQSAGTIRVQNGGVISADGTKMIGGSDANIALTDGYIDLKVDNSALGLSFVGATAEVPTGSRWTLVLGEAPTQMKMNVTLDKSTTLTVNGSKGDDTGFHVANGSTLTNNGTIKVNSTMSIGTSGKVEGSGTITVNAGGVLEASVNNAGTVGTLSNNVTVAGTFVWGGSAATDLTGTVTLASGGKVYSNADIADKLSGEETMSNKTYNGTDYNYAWQYDVPSSSSGGSSSSSSYTVSVASGIDNGKVTVSPKSASKGDTVTITVTPDEGYELDTLTVTDKNGDKISVIDKGNGKYTFTMPSGKVTIDAAFTEAAETPDQVGPFEDVSTADWFADAVQYMLDNGMMNGVTETTFAPNATTTRGMIVTMLHRLEGEPSAAASAFTDVAAGSYYADAVAWAAANGIVDGVSETSFAPDNAITREQMAAILYRYAEYKDYDTAVGGMSLAEYTDADQISSYAVTAM